MLVFIAKYRECYYKDKWCDGCFHGNCQMKKMFAKCVKEVMSLHKLNFDSSDDKIVKSNPLLYRSEQCLFLV